MCSRMLLWGAFLISLVSAYPFDPDESHLCIDACRRIIFNKVKFKLPEGSPKSLGSKCHTLLVGSLFACAAEYCTEQEIVGGFQSVNDTCIEKGTPLPTYTAITPLDENVTTISWPAVKKQNYTSAVLPDKPFHSLAYKTEYAINRAQIFNWIFAWTLTGFWALVLSLGTIHRIIEANHERRTASLDTSHSKRTPIRTWLRRHLILPYLFDLKYPGSPGPTRAEALFLFSYISLNFIFCFPGIEIFKESLLEWTKVQYERYIGNRVAHLALGNLPFIWLFAMRNNPFLWLTGWPYGTFSQLHRWISRLVVILVFVHGVCYTIGDHFQGRYRDRIVQDWYYCGVIAVICFFLLASIASRFVRAHAYDLFLATHISLAIVVLVGINIHLKGRFEKNFYGFIWPCVAIWAFDRLLRIGKVVRSSLSPLSKGVKASATLGQDWIRIDVSHFFGGKSPPPGATYYLYEPQRLRGYESHPFSISSWPYRSPDEPREVAGSAIEKETMISATVEPGAIEHADSDESPPATTKHSFLVRPRGGYTKSLVQSLATSAGTRDLTVLLEGPYTESLVLQTHSDILMIVGGIGITAAVSRIYALLASKQSLRLVWIARNQALVDDVFENELRSIRHETGIDVDVYITADEHAKETVIQEEHFKRHLGRPGILELVTEARGSASRSLGVFCCGPSELSRACRKAVCMLLGQEGKQLDFYQETFGW